MTCTCLCRWRLHRGRRFQGHRRGRVRQQQRGRGWRRPHRLAPELGAHRGTLHVVSRQRRWQGVCLSCAAPGLWMRHTVLVVFSQSMHFDLVYGCEVSNPLRHAGVSPSLPLHLCRIIMPCFMYDGHIIAKIVLHLTPKPLCSGRATTRCCTGASRFSRRNRPSCLTSATPSS
jgi:hypothetical protein